MEKTIDLQKATEKLYSDEHYYGKFGKKFLSNSDIDSLINNPSQFKIPKPENINFLFGKAFHELMMFGKTIHNHHVSASTRSTKIYKEAVLENEGQIMFLTKEWKQVNLLVEKALKNDQLRDIVKSSTATYEVPKIGTVLDDSEILWKCKVDINDEFIYDLKTTSNLNKFPFSAKLYDYDSQAFVYSKQFQKAMKFIAIEKDTGCVGFFDVTDKAYSNGHEKVIKAEENYKKYILNKTENLNNFSKYGFI